MTTRGIPIQLALFPLPPRRYAGAKKLVFQVCFRLTVAEYRRLHDRAGENVSRLVRAALDAYTGVPGGDCRRPAGPKGQAKSVCVRLTEAEHRLLRDRAGGNVSGLIRAALDAYGIAVEVGPPAGFAARGEIAGGLQYEW